MSYIQNRFCSLVIIFCFCVSGSVHAENSKVVGLESYVEFKMSDYEKAYELWKELADGGNATGMNNMSNLYKS
mgnify:CR=1 FL=1